VLITLAEPGRCYLAGAPAELLDCVAEFDDPFAGAERLGLLLLVRRVGLVAFAGEAGVQGVVEVEAFGVGVAVSAVRLPGVGSIS
jgi:hypothetical protein